MNYGKSPRSQQIARGGVGEGELKLTVASDLASVFLSEPQKEEVGEALHDVDFQQLKIENAQFLETIEARNQELIQLKLSSGNTLQVLNTYKVSSAPGPGTLPGFL